MANQLIESLQQFHQYNQIAFAAADVFRGDFFLRFYDFIGLECALKIIKFDD